MEKVDIFGVFFFFLSSRRVKKNEAVMKHKSSSALRLKMP